MINLYHGDCLEILPTLEAGSVDMILVDPPFGITQNKWDTVLDLNKMWYECKRVVKPNGGMVFFATQPFTSVLTCSNLKMFKHDWVWRKPKGTGHLNANRKPMRDKEDILVFCQKQPVFNPQMTLGTPFKKAGAKSQTTSYGTFGQFRNSNSGTRYPKQVLEYGVVENATLHPTQKPVPLLQYLIRTYTNKGDTVLDFCMGSGSTLVACIEEERNGIGIEKDAGYFEIAGKRIEQEQTKPRTMRMAI